MNHPLLMKPHKTRGMLITFCGLDGCGKSTLIRMLSDMLEAQLIPLLLTKQPTDAMRKTEIFRTYMDEPDHSRYEYRSLSLMAAADRVQHVRQIILPALEAGKTVICDRYFYSCLANLRARGYQKDKWIYEISQSIPKPDLAFFLNVPVEIAVARVRTRPEEKDRYIDMDLQHALHQEYIAICRENRGILLSTEQSIDDTFTKVIDHINKHMKGRFHEPH